VEGPLSDLVVTRFADLHLVGDSSTILASKDKSRIVGCVYGHLW